MSAVRLTAERARRLGIDASSAKAKPEVSASPPHSAKPRRRRPEATPQTCHDCGLRLLGETAVARHVADTGHARYQLELDL